MLGAAWSASAAAPGSRSLLPSAPLRLLPLGDSITDGDSKHTSYRYHLHRIFTEQQTSIEWMGSMEGVYDRQLGRNASSGEAVEGDADWPLAAQSHEGHWGWTAAQLLRGHSRQPQRQSLPKWLWGERAGERAGESAGERAGERTAERAGERVAPQAVLLHIGTNDITKLLHPAHTLPTSTILANVQQILALLSRAGVGLTLLATPIPYCRVRAANRARRRAGKYVPVSPICHTPFSPYSRF